MSRPFIPLDLPKSFVAAVYLPNVWAGRYANLPPRRWREQVW